MLLMLSLQVLMFSGALFLLAAPFVRNHHSLLSRSYLMIALLTLLFSSFLYLMGRDRAGLAAWFAGGKEHYQLQESFNALGGADGAVKALQKHLLENPRDAQAWSILGKLYLGKQDQVRARYAFAQAKKIYDGTI